MSGKLSVDDYTAIEQSAYEAAVITELGRRYWCELALLMQQLGKPPV
jgi:hypothetical protein